LHGLRRRCTQVPDTPTEFSSLPKHSNYNCTLTGHVFQMSEQ